MNTTHPLMNFASSSPILAYPDFKQAFILDTDASDTSVTVKWGLPKMGPPRPHYPGNMGTLFPHFTSRIGTPS